LFFKTERETKQTHPNETKRNETNNHTLGLTFYCGCSWIFPLSTQSVPVWKTPKEAANYLSLGEINPFFRGWVLGSETEKPKYKFQKQYGV